MKLFEAHVEISGKLSPLKTALRKARVMVSEATRRPATFAIKISLGALKRSLRLVKNMVTRTMRGIASTLSKISTTIIKYVKRVAIAITAMIGASIKAFSSFEEQLANVATMLNIQAMRLLPKYAKELQRLAVQFGESTDTLAAGLYNILSASIAPTKAIKVLEIAVRAAAAGMTDTSTAAYALTGIMNAYGMAADKAGKVSDILFATVLRGQTTFAQLATTIGRVTAISASAGVSLEEVAAALATITRGGISTEEAITSLRMVLISLQGNTESAVKLAKDHGIELSVEALKAKGLSGMLKELSVLSATTISDLFSEIRARMGLNVLLKDQTGFLKDLSITTNAAGLTAEAYSKQADLLTRKFRGLWEAIKITGVTIGAAFSEQTKTSIDKITKAIINAQDKIAVLAEKTASAIAIVKNVLIDFIKYLHGDWKTKLGSALKATLPIWQALATSIGMIFEKMWNEIENRALVVGKRILAKQLTYREEYKKALKKARRIKIVLPGGETRPIEKERAKEMARVKAREMVAYKEKYDIYKIAYPTIPTESWSSLMKRIGNDFDKAVNKSFGKLNPELQKVFEKATTKAAEAKERATEKADISAYEKARVASIKASRAIAKAAESEAIKRVQRMPTRREIFLDKLRRLDKKEELSAAVTEEPIAEKLQIAEPKFGFVGISDMWRTMVQSMTLPKDPVVAEAVKSNIELKQIKQYSKEGNILLRSINERIPGAGTVGP